MKKIASHRFKKSNKAINVYLVDKPIKGVPKCDTLCLEFWVKGRKKQTRIFIRPDEAILITKLLSESVYKSVSAYRVKYER